MSTRNRRPSLLGGLFWVGLGVMFLLLNFGIGLNVWRMIGRYWPIILIVMGLGKLIDYYRQKDGVALRFGELFGILFVILLGSLVARATLSPGIRDVLQHLTFRIGDNRVRIGEWQGTSYSFNDEANYTIAPGTRLRIENSYGAVLVTPGSDREVRVRLRKVVFHDDEKRAKEIAGEIKLEGGTVGAAEASGFVIRTNRDSLASKEYRFRTEMEVLVPKKSTLEVRNAFGELRVSNLEGKLDLATSHRTLEVRDCAADVLAANRYSDSNISNVTGKVKVEARGHVHVETVRGDVEVRDEFSPVEIIDVEGTVTVSNSEGPILVDRVSKPVVIDARGSQVTAQNLADSLKVTASHRQIRIHDVASNVGIDSRYATLSLQNIKGNVDITSNSDRISADEIGGYLKATGSGSSFRGNTIAGPVEIATSLKEVIVNDFSDACKVTNEYADVTLSTSSLLKGEVSVRNRNGHIDLFLPEDAAFQLEAKARNGRVDSDYPGIQQVETEDAGKLTAKVRAGGPRVVLETEYSNIRVRVRGDESERRRPRRERGRDSESFRRSSN